ncbi:hypothetical protein BC941DRAFT_443958 [Chlamydoabsidia padenii]|nr:hypothetical protein BC941DRAFT_443958 [Chlamydoabsidia padenii]
MVLLIRKMSGFKFLTMNQMEFFFLVSLSLYIFYFLFFYLFFNIFIHLQIKHTTLMKPSIPVANLTNTNPDAIRWFIIGAYQAGASETEIVSLTNLSRYTIRYTIASFVRTGLPHLRKQKEHKPKIQNDNLAYQYKTPLSNMDNEDGGLSDSSSDEEDEEDEEMNTGDNNDVKKEEQNEDQQVWKNSLLLRRKGNSTARDTMEYVLYKGRKFEEKRLNTWQKQHYRKLYRPPPSPPHDVLIRPKSEPYSPPTSPESSHTPTPTKTSFGLWSQQDDKILLRHILTRTGNWDKLDQVFDGKHSVSDCIERWDVLQYYLIKELKKTGTSSW